MPAGSGDRQRPDGDRVGVQSGAHREPQFRLVRPDTDHDVATDPMRTADPADGDLHEPSANLAGLQQVNADVLVPGQRADHGPQRTGSTPAPADDLAEV